MFRTGQVGAKKLGAMSRTGHRSKEIRHAGHRLDIAYFAGHVPDM